jgi:hypothetical protein
MYGKQIMSQSNNLHHESLEDDPCSWLPATPYNKDNVRQLQEGCVPQIYFWVYYSQ